MLKMVQSRSATVSCRNSEYKARNMYITKGRVTKRKPGDHKHTNLKLLSVLRMRLIVGQNMTKISVKNSF